jgi:hypothetical protein
MLMWGEVMGGGRRGVSRLGTIDGRWSVGICNGSEFVSVVATVFKDIESESDLFFGLGGWGAEAVCMTKFTFECGDIDGRFLAGSRTGDDVGVGRLSVDASGYFAIGEVCEVDIQECNVSINFLLSCEFVTIVDGIEAVVKICCRV